MENCRSVLVVDDNRSICEMLETVLGALGYQAVTAADGAKALRAVEKQDVDLVITDILMPEMDGLALISEIHRRRPGLPIVAMSGGGHFIDRDHCLRSAKLLGAAATLRKPFTVDELQMVIEGASGAAGAR